jgi:outer membrane receptor protein involved in Fe transport
MTSCDRVVLGLCVGLLALVGPGRVEGRQVAVRFGGGIVRGVVTSQPQALPVVAVIVDVLEAASGRVVATARTGDDGRYEVGGLAPGFYTVRATLVGFDPAVTPPVEVTADRPVEVSLDLRVSTFTEIVSVVAPARSTIGGEIEPGERTVSGRLLDVAPLPGDDLQALFTLLPGVVRGPEGRLRLKGDLPSQGAVLVSGVNVGDPVTGDFAFELPNDAVESVEVLGSPYLAEYGRFSAGVATVTTRRAGDTWKYSVNNFVPRPLKRPDETFTFRGLRSFSPRATIGGPLVADRLWLTEAVQYRYVRTPMKSQEGEPTMDLRSLDVFTRLDAHLSTRHTLTSGLVVFPRAIEKVNLNTFVTPAATPDFEQRGFQAGVQDNLVLAATTVLESTLSVRRYDVDIERRGRDAMVLSPSGISGSFYNEQTRRTRTVQGVAVLSHAPSAGWFGAHLFRVGVDVSQARYTGTSRSGRVEIRRSDGTLAEVGTFGDLTRQREESVDLALFVQDRWRVSERLSLDLGLRFDRDGVVDRFNANPRIGVVYSLDRDARTVVRGGLGLFSVRTPYNVAALSSFEPPTYASFDPAGDVVVEAVRLDFAMPARLETPSSRVWSVDLQHRVHPALALKVGYLERRGKDGFYLEPMIERGVIELRNDGRSRYREVEATARYVRGPRVDLQASYVWSSARADLNSVDTYYGNFRWPVVRPNAFARTNTDVPHRLLVRGAFVLPWKIDLLPVVELRSGFPWSAVSETQRFLGERNEAGRLPAVRTVDVSISRPVKLMKFRPRVGLRLFNLLGNAAARDVQNNVASPDYGRFFHPIERSVGVVFQFGGV